MYAERHTVAVVTDAAGAAVAYTPRVTGRVRSVQYVKTDFAAGVDFDVTVEGTGEVVWDEDNVNASKIVYPRAQVHDTLGVAATLDGVRAMRDPIAVAADRIKIAVAAGGDTKSGTFHVVIG